MDQLRIAVQELLQKYRETFPDLRDIVVLENLTRGEVAGSEILKAREIILEDHKALFEIIQRWRLNEYLRHVYIDYSRRGMALEGILTKQFPISNYRTVVGTQIRFVIDPDVLTDYKNNKNTRQFNLDSCPQIGCLECLTQREEVTLIPIPGETQFIAEFE